MEWFEWAPSGHRGSWRLAWSLSTHHHGALQGFRPIPDGHTSKGTQRDCQPRPWHGHSLPGPARCGERRSWAGWLSPPFWKHLLLWLPAGAMPGWAGCALATEAGGPPYSPLGRSCHSQSVLFCNCLLGRGRSVWWALGDFNMTGSLGRCSYLLGVGCHI